MPGNGEGQRKEVYITLNGQQGRRKVVFQHILPVQTFALDVSRRKSFGGRERFTHNYYSQDTGEFCWSKTAARGSFFFGEVGSFFYLLQRCYQSILSILDSRVDARMDKSKGFRYNLEVGMSVCTVYSSFLGPSQEPHCKIHRQNFLERCGLFKTLK